MSEEEFITAVQAGQVIFPRNTLDEIDWFYIPLRLRGYRLRWSRWPRISFGQTEEERMKAMELRKKVADQLEATPELWDQRTWWREENGYMSFQAHDASCGTPACIAGWTARFVDPTCDTFRVANLAWRSLWCDRKPMPSFHIRAGKIRNLAALRA